MIGWLMRLCLAVVGVDEMSIDTKPAPKLFLPKRSLKDEWRQLK